MVIDGLTLPHWQSESLLTQIGRDPGPRNPNILLLPTQKHTHPHAVSLGYSFLSRVPGISPHPPPPFIKRLKLRVSFSRRGVRDGFRLGLYTLLAPFFFACCLVISLNLSFPSLCLSLSFLSRKTDRALYSRTRGEQINSLLIYMYKYMFAHTLSHLTLIISSIGTKGEGS